MLPEKHAQCTRKLPETIFLPTNDSWLRWLLVFSSQGQKIVSEFSLRD